MRLGMTLPIMEAGLDRQTLQAWAQRIDRGPWHSLALGERIAFVNPECLTTLAACAAWTERVELISTVTVAALHNPAVLAKQLATIDLISAGRLTAGVGTGGRKEDYLAAGTPWARHTLAALKTQVKSMQAIWQGKVPEGLPRAIEPRPVRGHIPVLAGALGPKAIACAADYADGLCGFSFAATAADMEQTFRQVRLAWQQAGRPQPPRLVSSFWFAVGDPATARAQINRHLRHYLSWLPASTVEAMLPHTGFAGTVAELKAHLAELAATGADDLLLVPTSPDVRQLDALESLFH